MSATPYSDGLSAPARTLGDVIGAAFVSDRAPTWARDAALVIAGTLLLTLGAYVSFTVPAVQLGLALDRVADYYRIA